MSLTALIVVIEAVSATLPVGLPMAAGTTIANLRAHEYY